MHSGHGGVVSSVAFCPAHPHLLASASDDHSVRLWVAPESSVGGAAAGGGGGGGGGVAAGPLVVLRAVGEPGEGAVVVEGNV